MCLCLLAKPLEIFKFFFQVSERVGLIWIFQTGTEADDTAIICSFRRSIDSRCTLSATDGGSRLLKFKKYADVLTLRARACLCLFEPSELESLNARTVSHKFKRVRFMKPHNE